MSELSPRIGLPYIQPAQAQKHVTHNEAVAMLDAAVQLVLTATGSTTPPVTPALGETHALGAAPTGDWAGQAGRVATWSGSAWTYVDPRSGWTAWSEADGALLRHDGATWVPVLDGGSDMQNLPGLGVNATWDAVNRLAVQSQAVLLSHDGAGIETTLNKAAPAHDASLAFKTGYSARALVGLLGSDNLTIKVSDNGTTYTDAVTIEAGTGRVELAAPLILPQSPSVPAPPPAGRIALYGRERAGAGWLDVQRSSGRFFPLQPHFGVNRIATWSPSNGATVNVNGMPRTLVGTTSTPTLAVTNLSTSMRRWRVTSAATAGSAAEERSAGWVCWRGNAAGLGGFSYVNRLSLVTLQSAGTGFFGLLGATTALSTSATLASLTNCVGIGFDLGTHANWRIVHNDNAGAPTQVNLGGAFSLASTTAVLTLTLSCAPNGTEIGLRVVEEESGAAVEAVLSSDIPGPAQLLSPRNYLNNGGIAAAVAYDCSGLYIETDY